MQKALITGGSSGIGYEIAKVMATRGHDLVLVARDKTQLTKVAKELEQEFQVKVNAVVSDLSLSGSAKKLYESLKNDGIEILVNNAGVGLKGDFFEGDIDQNTKMMQLNMTSLTELTHYFGKDFVKQGRGRILNVASVAAFLPGPKQPVYYATKSFVRSLSRALSYNLRGTGVTVTTLHPGLTRTNFFKAANAPSVIKGASSGKVAELGYIAMMSGKIEVTHGLWNKILTNIFIRIIPYRIQTLMVDKNSEV
jgi:uncharacterized protein